MRFLVRLQATKVPEGSLLETVRALAKATGVDPRNPKRTSYGALELDFFCPARPDFELFIAAVEPVAKVEFATDLNVAPPHREESELFSQARSLFNSERYWECHEALEGVWRTKQGEEKSLLQGIILVCAAFVHHQKGEEGVAIGVLGRATKQLDFPERRYGGFDVPALKRNVEGIIQSTEFTNFRV